MRNIDPISATTIVPPKVVVSRAAGSPCSVCGSFDPKHSLMNHPWLAVSWFSSHRQRFADFVAPCIAPGTSMECIPDGNSIKFTSPIVQAMWLVYCFGVLTPKHIGHDI